MDLLSRLAPGFVFLGKYEFLRLLGRGGMGEVWKARHIALGSEYAIKFMTLQGGNEAEFAARFQHEAKTAHTVESPYIVKVIDFGIEDRVPYLVMNFHEGRDLDEVLHSRGVLPIVEAVRYVLQVSEGLAAAHAKGVTHRDIKPANLFWCDVVDPAKPGAGRGLVRILDFGIASGTNRTMTAGMIGSPQYMPPEQVTDGKLADARSDIYALAATLFQLTTGRTLFDGESIQELLFKVVGQEAPRADAVVRGYPSGLADVLARALSKKQADRFASMGEFAAALAPFAEADANHYALAATAYGLPTAPQRFVSPAPAVSSPPLREATWRPEPGELPLLRAVPPSETVGPVAGVPHHSDRTPLWKFVAADVAVVAAVVAGFALRAPSLPPDQARTDAGPGPAPVDAAPSTAPLDAASSPAPLDAGFVPIPLPSISGDPTPVVKMRPQTPKPQPPLPAKPPCVKGLRDYGGGRIEICTKN